MYPYILLVGSVKEFYNGSQSVFTYTFSSSYIKSVNVLLVKSNLFIYLFGVLRRFQHCTGHITTGSWKGRGNQYIEFVRVLYCKLPTNGKQLPAFPLETVRGSNPGLRGERQECYQVKSNTIPSYNSVQ